MHVLLTPHGGAIHDPHLVVSIFFVATLVIPPLATLAAREQPCGKKTVLIAVTGWGQDEDKRRAHEAGFDLHMVKPVDPASLMRIVADLYAAKGASSV